MIITYCFDAGQLKKNPVKRVQILFVKYQYHILFYYYQPECSSTVYIIIFSFKMSYIKCKYILVHLKQLPLVPFFFPHKKTFPLSNQVSVEPTTNYTSRNYSEMYSNLIFILATLPTETCPSRCLHSEVL